MKLTFILIAIVISVSLFIFSIKNRTQLPSEKPPLEIQKSFALPIADLKSRVTKKPFGIYITPKNSPVFPEKFTGYHTGIDVEYQDVSIPVPVQAISDGKVLYSAWTKGYGGVTAILHNIDSKPVIAIYGHLDPKSMISINSEVKKDQEIGILGKGYTSETDNERKHLHFALYPGTKLNLLGYVQKKSELSNWIDPLSLYP